MSNKGRIEAVAGAIEHYLSQNPRAADTATGIRSWWLPEELRAEPLRTVVGALDVLRTRGVINKTRRRGGAVIYSVKPAAQPWKH